MSYTNGLDKPSDYFNTILYTGTGTSPLSVTGVGFQPDFLWIKRRDSSGSHRLTDIVRGVANHLETNNTDAEKSSSGIGSFDSDGWTFNSTGVSFNTSGGTYAGWNWLAGGTGVSNTQGSITSTVSANTTAGFSVVSWTGTGVAGTIGHGLGATPSMYIVKKRSAVEDWEVYHKSLGATKDIRLNSTGAVFTSILWNNTEPTDNVFSVYTGQSVNNSGSTYIAYCFAPKKGFSSMGSYIGNGSTDGTFVFTGMKPAFVMIKRTDSATGADWRIRDSVRTPYNDSQQTLYANLSDSESTASGNAIDFVSNGFKIRNTSAGINASGGTYIYMCFAENPFVTSTGIPTTAR